MSDTDAASYENDESANAKPLDHEAVSTLPNGSARVHASSDSNPQGPAVRDGSVMWAAPTPNGVGPRSGGPGAPGARIVTDPPGAQRDGGAGASVATGAPAVLAEAGLPRSAAKPNVIEARNGREGGAGNEAATLAVHFGHEASQARSTQPVQSLAKATDADAGVPGARIVTDPPSARRDGGAGASVATGAHAARAAPEPTSVPFAAEGTHGEAEMANSALSALAEAAVARYLDSARALHSYRIRRGIEAKRRAREQGS